MEIKFLFTDTKKLVKLEDVIFILSLRVNLLSLSKKIFIGYNLFLKKVNCYIYTSIKD